MTTEISVASHFDGKQPNVKATYDYLIAALNEFGPVTEAPKQTSIHLENATGFAGVYTRKSYILLHFRTDYRIDSPRIEKTEQLSARRFKHAVSLESENDVNDELLVWLKDAYELAAAKNTESE
jgi:Domain of unknown function (DUF5655)